MDFSFLVRFAFIKKHVKCDHWFFPVKMKNKQTDRQKFYVNIMLKKEYLKCEIICTIDVI